MKRLVKTCKNNSLLMTVELCYPCSQLVEQGNDFKPDWDTLQPYIDRIAELELKIVMLDEACANCGVKTTDGYALYCVKCSEPMREWLDLTDAEIANAVGSPIDEVYLVDFRKVIAKLKEKNHD